MLLHVYPAFRTPSELCIGQWYSRFDYGGHSILTLALEMGRGVCHGDLLLKAKHSARVRKHDTSFFY